MPKFRGAFLCKSAHSILLHCPVKCDTIIRNKAVALSQMKGDIIMEMPRLDQAAIDKLVKELLEKNKLRLNQKEIDDLVEKIKQQMGNNRNQAQVDIWVKEALEKLKQQEAK